MQWDPPCKCPEEVKARIFCEKCFQCGLGVVIDQSWKYVMCNMYIIYIYV